MSEHKTAETQHNERQQQYQDARKAFNELKIEERAFFLLDAAASTLVHVLEETGNVLSRELDAFFKSFESKKATSEAPEETAHAEGSPEAGVDEVSSATEEAPAPQKATGKAKKPTAKKTSTKKKTSRSKKSKGDA